MNDPPSSGTYPFFAEERRIVADDVVDRDAHGEGHAPIHDGAVRLLGVQLGGARVQDRVSELAQVDHLGPGDALLDQPLQGQIHDLGRLLIFGANIAANGQNRRRMGEP